jgi:hypothetical protein
MNIIRAVLETRNFYFESYGKTKDDAYSALLIGLKSHEITYKLEDDWYSIDEIEYHNFEIGFAYRNNELIKAKE